MAAAVVDDLELVKVHVQQEMMRVAGMSILEQVVQALVELSAVDKPGQFVINGLPFHFGDGGFLFRGIAHDADHKVAAFHVHPVHADVDPAWPGVFWGNQAFEANRVACEHLLELKGKHPLTFFAFQKVGDGDALVMRAQFHSRYTKPGFKQTVGDMEFHFVAHDKNAVVCAVYIGTQQGKIKILVFVQLEFRYVCKQ